jgi:hypothetical protein
VITNILLSIYWSKFPQIRIGNKCIGEYFNYCHAGQIYLSMIAESISWNREICNDMKDWVNYWESTSKEYIRKRGAWTCSNKSKNIVYKGNKSMINLSCHHLRNVQNTTFLRM